MFQSDSTQKTWFVIWLSFFCFILPSPLVFSESVLFVSTQLTPLPEAEQMRHYILKGFPHSVDFQPYDNRVAFRQLVDSSGETAGFPILIGGLYEDFLALKEADAIGIVDGIMAFLSEREFIETYSQLGKLDSANYHFVPWMSATYVMAANRQALKYLPRGVDLNNITFEQLGMWAANVHQATGSPKLGFPAGPKGLMPQFLEGYLYPSYTGNMTEKFNSPEAEIMWKSLGSLWEHATPQSFIMNRMDKHLLSEEVWIAWDHTARLLEAFKERPGDFVAFPAPVGPAGRGFLLVLAGLGLPKGPAPPILAELIRYLTDPDVQLKTMESVGFMPVIQIESNDSMRPGLAKLYSAGIKQIRSGNAISNFQLLYDGEIGESIDLVYMMAFSRIVLSGRNIQSVLQEGEKRLNQIMSSSPGMSKE